MPSYLPSFRRLSSAWLCLVYVLATWLIGCQVTVDQSQADGLGGSGGLGVGGAIGAGGAGDSCVPFPKGATACFQEGLNCSYGTTTCPCEQLCGGTSCSCTDGLWVCYTWDLVGPPCGGGGEGGEGQGGQGQGGGN